MHELGIMYHIVKQVLTLTTENSLTEVDAIVLQVGEASGVIPRYLQSCFPAAADGTILEHTNLEIEILLANGICSSCKKVYALTEHSHKCPVCGETGYEMIGGREFYLKEIRAR